ncbi:ultraviolet-B receptor UVR8 isoform X3 [Rutidosis leptorrhynchoides]|uniref:ultraviolet-B receptor UVR8 isoform X3 n=1 Tax=Rutidosis leptorrhynchoides TaxID=125765 RepID=UPI003A99EBD6
MPMATHFMSKILKSAATNGKLGLGFCQKRFIRRVLTCEEQELIIDAEPLKNRKIVALWGNGDYGRLGLGNLESKWRPAFVSSFDDGNLREIACGGAHTLFLTESGSVYASGLNDCGQLGVEDGRSYTLDPVEISGLPNDIVKVAAGYYHSSAITESGELYVWGKNTSGQLGLGRKTGKVIPVPTKVNFLNGVPIKMASLGSDHSIAVTENGEVLSWGGGESGRLGHGHKTSLLGFLSTSSEYTPRLIKELEGAKIKSVAAGMLHSACIDENGSVFIFGEKAVNKLVSREGGTVTTPSMIRELPFSEQVACGAHHTCVVTRGGELYTWGSNENGCLGTGDTHTVHVPERVQGPFLMQSVSKVSCGWKHTAAISDGNVYTWGWGGAMGTFFEEEHSSGGQLGLGDDVDYVEPTKVNFGENVKAVQISCGFNHTGALLEYN